MAVPEPVALAAPGSGFERHAASLRPGSKAPPRARPDAELLGAFRSSASIMTGRRPQQPAQQQPAGAPPESGVGAPGNGDGADASGFEPGMSAAVQEQRQGLEGVPPQQAL
jgi:hypothetical protein